MNAMIAPFVAAAMALAATVAPALAFASEDELTIVDAGGEVLATFDQADAEALGMRDLVTATPWTKGRVHFSGVPFRDLLDAVDLSGVDVTMIALDDYVATLTWEDIAERGAFLATRMNGTPLTLDRKGPFWMVFDFDEAEATELGEMHSKTVWHIVVLEIE